MALLYAMTGARGLCGGIATANLNVLHALDDLAHERGMPLRVLSLWDRMHERPDFLPPAVRFDGCAGSRRRFALHLLEGARPRPTYCFDHVSLALPVLPLAATRRIKTVIFAHGSEAWRRVRRSSRWSFEHAALCLTNSQLTLRRMRMRLPHLRAVACPLGLSPEFPLSEPPLPPAEPVALRAADGQVRPLGDQVLLLVGRMDPREREKGHHALIDVLPEVRREFPHAQVVFPGPGDDRAPLETLAGARGVADAVFIPGRVSNQMLRRLYHRCYALVMPSTQEGFGLVYLEAMNYAKPCVGCADDGAGDVIVDGETGVLVRHPDRSELLAVVLTLLRDPARAQRLGRRGLERLRASFTAQHHQRRVKAAIAEVL